MDTQQMIDELAAKGFITFHRDDVQELKAEVMVERHWHNLSPSKAAIAATINLANILTQNMLEEKLIKVTPPRARDMDDIGNGVMQAEAILIVVKPQEHVEENVTPN